MKNLADPNTPQKVLCVCLSGIGNLVMQAPVFEAIKKFHPNWHITVWVAPRGTKAIADNDPYIDEVIEAPHKNSIRGHLKLIKELRAKKFDIGIVLSPGQLIKSAAYLYLAGIPNRIGSAYPFRGNPHSSFLLTQSIVEDENLHDIEQNLRLLKPLGIPLPSSQINYALLLDEQTKEKAKQILSSIPGPYIGLHAGSAPDFLWKRWPLENFAQVAKKVIERHHAHILLFGGPDEKLQNEELKKMIDSPSVTVIQENLLTVAAMMQLCKLVLSNDSGLMHISSAVGTTTFGMFGPTNEVHTGPRGPKSHVIRAQDTKPIFNTESNYYLGQDPHPSILAITPSLVIASIHPYL